MNDKQQIKRFLPFFKKHMVLTSRLQGQLLFLFVLFLFGFFFIK